MDTDLFQIDELLTPEERRIRDSVRGFVQRDSMPVIRMNLETVRTYDGTRDIHALSVGQALAGFSAFE